MEEHLTVYRASAGSGKTFTLAVEYISLLVKDPENYQQGNARNEDAYTLTTIRHCQLVTVVATVF